MQKESGRPLMDALVTFLSRNNHNVIIEGVESEAHKNWLQGMEWFAIQGHYWKEVSIEQLVQERLAHKNTGHAVFLYAKYHTLNYTPVPRLPSWSVDRLSLFPGTA
jgi:EAL domain-containing protein (putative c-di-GMP-specific phosphodiesterase class I)